MSESDTYCLDFVGCRSIDLRVVPDPSDVAVAAADLIEEAVADGGALGVATGATPAPAYAEVRRRGVDLAGVDAFLLDEYVGLAVGDPRSFGQTIRVQLGVIPRAPDVHADDLPAAARAYDAAIVAAGVGLQVLGIGRNGHLGFNEPGAALDGRTQVVRLDPATRAANAEAFGSPDAVPERAVTQGLGTILDARRLLLLAIGPTKASAVAAALTGPVTTAVPASVLQRHGDVVVVVDEAAAGALR